LYPIFNISLKWSSLQEGVNLHSNFTKEFAPESQ